MIRVAHVIGRIAKAGVESVVFNYYRFIDKSKVQFDFIIDENSPCEIPAEILNLGCKVYKTPSYKHLSAYIKSLQRIFVEGKYKIVHSHMNTLSVFAMYAAKKADVPVRISHSHSTAGKGEFARNIMKYALRPFSKMFPTDMFACSEYTGRWLFGDAAFNAGKVKVIKNAIDVARFTYNEEIRNKVKENLQLSGKFIIGHVGRFMPQKNHTFLIDIFAEVYKKNNNSVLLLIGDGKLREATAEKVERLGLQGNVMFLGARNDIQELYQAMDVFVLPSLYEGLAVVRVEALSAGLPCLMSAGLTTELETVNDKFIGISAADLPEWRDSIIACENIKRASGIETLKSQGYDITEAARELDGFYLENFEEGQKKTWRD
jgi:glycosyltransferase EpsF